MLLYYIMKCKNCEKLYYNTKNTRCKNCNCVFDLCKLCRWHQSIDAQMCKNCLHINDIEDMFSKIQIRQLTFGKCGNF